VQVDTSSSDDNDGVRVELYSRCRRVSSSVNAVAALAAAAVRFGRDQWLVAFLRLTSSAVLARYRFLCLRNNLRGEKYIFKRARRRLSLWILLACVVERR